jgi:hypothetical protein
MEKELLRQQIKPLLLFGLPAWVLMVLTVYSKQKLFFGLLVVTLLVYVIMAMVNRGRFRDLYREKYSPKWGFRLAPHYVEGEDELNHYYAIDLRWIIIFFGTAFASLIACFCPIN